MHDLVIRGGRLIAGTGASGRPADVVVEGDVVGSDAAYVDGSTVTVCDVRFDAMFDVIEENPELMGRSEPPTAEILALVGDREGFRMQPPGSVEVRFE